MTSARAVGWEQMVADRDEQLGPDEPETQSVRVQLAAAYGELGRVGDERALLEQVVASWGRLAATRERQLGPAHPDTVHARDRHAHSHRRVGRIQDEVALVEQIAADHVRLLGPAHPRTLHAQVRLALRYYEGSHDPAAAIALGERIIAEVRGVLGAEHGDLQALRAMLILAYAQTGRADDGLALAAAYPVPEE